MEKYEKFEEKVRKISNIEQASGVLGWDQEVMMPEEGAKSRSKQMSALSSIQHQLLTDEDLGKIIEELKSSDLDEEQEANVREVEEDREKAVKVPEELLTKIAEKKTESVESWREAREENQFEVFQPHLEEMVELKREYAKQVDSDKEPYQVLFEDYEPFLNFETMEEILEELKDRLTEIIEQISESETELSTDVFKGEFSEEKQEELNRELVEALNFDFKRGRMDSSTHPFTSGNQFDTRVTTRYNESDLSKSLLPTIHETGHALYNQGVPREKYGLPIGEPRELSIHESQSRLWENHVGRSIAFQRFLIPKLKQKFSDRFEDVEPEEMYHSLNQVYEDNPIRVEADELTYHLHIIVRFELGRKLINGNMEVEDLPEEWDKKMEKYLGITPENDAEGCLQDIHWSWGNFGYFPTYSLGSVLAAQIFEAVEKEIDDLDQKIAEGEFEPLLDWLRENIHSKGKLYPTEELIERSTGKKPTSEPFLRYIEEKYSQLYNLDL